MSCLIIAFIVDFAFQFAPHIHLQDLNDHRHAGRIRLIKAVANGAMPITKEFVYEMNFCLDCQACETACPAGIQYGYLVEAARAQSTKKNKTAQFSIKPKRSC